MKYSSAGQVGNKFEAEKLAGDILKDLKPGLQDSILANAGDGIFGKLLSSIVTKIIDASAVAANNAVAEKLMDNVETNEQLNNAASNELAKQAALDNLQDQAMQNALEIPGGEFDEMPEDLEEEKPEGVIPEGQGATKEGATPKTSGKFPTPASNKESPAKNAAASGPAEAGTPASPTPTNDSFTGEDSKTAKPTGSGPNANQSEEADEQNQPADSTKPASPLAEQLDKVNQGGDGSVGGAEQSSPQPKDTSITKNIPKMGRVINFADYKKRKRLGTMPKDEDKQPADQATESKPDDQQASPQPSAPAETPATPTDGEASTPEGEQPEAQPNQDNQSNVQQPGQEGQEGGQNGEQGQSAEGENQEEQSPEENKVEQMRVRNRALQFFNKRRFADQIRPLDAQLKIHNKEVADIQRKINQKKNKIKPLTTARRALQVAKWSLRILQILLYVIAAILAASIIFLILIPIAPFVYYAARAMGAPIAALDAQIMAQNKKIKKLEDEIKADEEKRNKLIKTIQQLYAQKRAIINRSLRQQKQEQEENATPEEEMQQAA